jgi:glucosamine-6-phosphate deaminase
MNSPKIVVYADRDQLCKAVAHHLANIVIKKPNAVLGLPTGSSPIGIYNELARMHREEGLDFSQTVSFNLDEYYPMLPDDPLSYDYFMRHNLFDHVNFKSFSVPNGKPRSQEQIAEDCAAYEANIKAAGGLDFQLLGIGRNGHIGFNEPGSARDARTRLLTLNPITRTDAANDFGSLDKVPTQAVTMGVGTIMEAPEILLMASGSHKAHILHQTFTAPISSEIPSTYLREHPNTQFWFDESAAAEILADSSIVVERA